ncbi:hypothetical protein M885DRAFT_461426 [Pelagophyceae sp. CCMP2097]|nr:hypothetical protein M885DRAFT_461426 [Pelagophyceae sp. CCMP2097]
MAWRQESPDEFRAESFRQALKRLNVTDAAKNLASRAPVGLTFQWELLDCFLSPHSCTLGQVVEGVRNFLDSAVQTQTPVQVTLDPHQFFYESNLWNWWNGSLPGFDAANVHNVEWTGFSPAFATKIAWRNWGSQFRMPTPQPNLASPELQKAICGALQVVLAEMRRWYEAADDSGRALLVDVKLGEEVDVGANFYFYPGGNDYLDRDQAGDPKQGLDFSKGLDGGLLQLGYNMVQTLRNDSDKRPPTRREVTRGVQDYFGALVEAADSAWPALKENRKLSLHAGLVGDPDLLHWDAPMVGGAKPSFTSYPALGAAVAEPGLVKALQKYDPSGSLRWNVGESTCFDCRKHSEWMDYFDQVFGGPSGEPEYLRIYNLDGAVSAKGFLTALKHFSKRGAKPPKGGPETQAAQAAQRLCTSRACAHLVAGHSYERETPPHIAAPPDLPVPSEHAAPPKLAIPASPRTS